MSIGVIVLASCFFIFYKNNYTTLILLHSHTSLSAFKYQGEDDHPRMQFIDRI
jgi:hypothetical protein